MASAPFDTSAPEKIPRKKMFSKNGVTEFFWKKTMYQLCE
jgi:hypothetical protein